MNINTASSFANPLLDALRKTGGGAAADKSGVGKASFGSAFDQALRSVSQTQNDAMKLTQDFQLNPESVSLEETMIAMQKSQIAFQSALNVRNRMVSAYTDIMNMQV